MSKKALFFVLLIIFSITTFFVLRDPPPYLTVIGPIQMADGIGRQAVDFMEAFYDEMKISYFFPTKIHNMNDVPKRTKLLLKRNYRKKITGNFVFYHDCIPKSRNKCLRKLGPKVPSQIRIAYSMCESTRLPQHCVALYNEHFDAIAVPDPFLVDVYKESGITLPIFVLPLGLNIKPFLTAPLKKEANTPFCFINTSSFAHRKNHTALIKAFYQAFGNNPHVELRMNYRFSHSDALKTGVALLNKLQCPNISLTDKKLNNKEYLEYLAKGDVFVTLSRGEGFSIQPREAMALGLPVIISDNTAHKSILKSNLACGISCPQETISINDHLGCLAGKGFEVDIDKAAQAMRDIYENYDKALLEANERRKWASQYIYDNLKPLYRNLFIPKKITLGEIDEITEEGLTTSSKELYQKYKKLVCKQ